MKIRGVYVCLLLLIVGGAFAAEYYPGDLVRLSKRSQNGNKMTTWTPMTSSLCPRFQQPKSIELQTLTDDFLLRGPNTRLQGSNFKFMLGFDGLNFISPWFPVKDLTRGMSLVMLHVVFVFNGPNIIDVKWDADYNDHGDHGDLEIKPVIVNYTWEQFSEEDTELGIASILIYGIIASVGLLVYVMFHETENVSSLSSDLPVVFTDMQAQPSIVSGDSLYTPPPLHGGSTMSIPPPSFKTD